MVRDKHFSLFCLVVSDKRQNKVDYLSQANLICICGWAYTFQMLPKIRPNRNNFVRDKHSSLFCRKKKSFPTLTKVRRLRQRPAALLHPLACPRHDAGPLFYLWDRPGMREIDFGTFPSCSFEQDRIKKNSQYRSISSHSIKKSCLSKKWKIWVEQTGSERTLTIHLV